MSYLTHSPLLACVTNLPSRDETFYDSRLPPASRLTYKSAPLYLLRTPYPHTILGTILISHRTVDVQGMDGLLLSPWGFERSRLDHSETATSRMSITMTSPTELHGSLCSYLHQAFRVHRSHVIQISHFVQEFPVHLSSCIPLEQ